MVTIICLQKNKSFYNYFLSQFVGTNIKYKKTSSNFDLVVMLISVYQQLYVLKE